MIETSTFTKTVSRATAGLKKQVKRTILHIPYLGTEIKNHRTAREHDFILKSTFAPNLLSDWERIQISEIEINRNCNLDCVMCNTSLSQRPQRNMELALFEHVLLRTKELGQNRVCLHTIGEPLVNPQLEEYLKLLRKHAVKVFLSTNGLFLKKRLEMLFNYVDVIDVLRLSIDGASKETYEKIRRPGKFDRLIENLEHLIEANRKRRSPIPLRIDSIVSTDVQHELAYHMSFYGKYVGIDNIDLHLVSGLSPDNSYFLQHSILKQFIQPWHPCDQLFSSTMHVLNDGRTTACCRDYNGDLVYGDIGASSPRDLINNDRVLELRMQHLEDRIPKGTLCADCYRIDPRVSSLFQLFVRELVARFARNWEVPKMQARFDAMFTAFQNSIPPREAFVNLLRS